jgi:phosphatidate phosphatase PAH1
MRLVDVLLLSALVPSIVACAVDPIGDDDDGDDDTTVVTPPEQPSAPTVTRCTTVPDAGASEDWRHFSSNLIVETGDPHHRGLDLIATTEDAIQTLGGRLTYGPTDKDLEDEDADIFACISGAWQKLARVTTDGEGRFSLTLSGTQRLPEGMRDLYLSVVGDRTGVPFVALVGAAGSAIVVSDVDGTLTSSENAYPTSLVTGDDVAAQPDAAARLNLAAQHGASIVYITTRGDRFTQDTRTWLAAKGFPFGAVRMPPAIITVPGEDTIEAKTAMLGDLAGFELLAGVGNRHTDVEAYTNAGIPADHIFIKLPEFESELTNDLAQNRATRIDQYIAMPM